jgi:hypothetical protein
MTDILTEWWWPSPGAFDNLTVTDTEDGWDLSAPDDTELAEWLSYWNQSEEHHALFQTVFVKALTDHAELVIENYGKTQAVPDEQSSDREQAEDVGTGSQS